MLLQEQLSIANRCINTIRTLSIDAIQKANSGHPGAPMGLAPAGFVLWNYFMRHNPTNPRWFDRDRFVLSGGHASMLLYSLLHLTGYDLSIEDIEQFRQLESKTPGHPEYGVTPGVETTTGPLGQGFANAVGMAMAEAFLSAKFNRDNFEIVNHHTYITCGDGDLMEGISNEAASLAGHLGLSKLICIYDSNHISIEGKTDITFTENVGNRFAALGWNIFNVADGNDISSLYTAIEYARNKSERPSLIIVTTQIAYGSPNKQNTADAHGAPLGEDEVRLTKINLGVSPDLSFLVPQDVEDYCNAVSKGVESEKEWNIKFEKYAKAFPDLAKEFRMITEDRLDDSWSKNMPSFLASEKPIATRAASGKVLNAIASSIPTLMGGSADLAPSNNTFLKGFDEFQKGCYQGRNIRFGVREHAMAAICSGLALHKGIRPYCGTFLVFADYMRPSIRVASLMKVPVIYVFTHDSIAVGEDGPTHQPVEHLASLRMIPNLSVIRPSDATETVEAWRYAIECNQGPIALILSRQNLSIIDRQKFASASNLKKGAYILSDSSDKPKLILIATGSEVELALAAQKVLKEKGISSRVVSMPSQDLFEKQGQAYKNEVIPPDVSNRIVIEAGISMGWQRYAGDKGKYVCMDSFGASGPGNAVREKFGFTVENVVRQALSF